MSKPSCLFFFFPCKGKGWRPPPLSPKDPSLGLVKQVLPATWSNIRVTFLQKSCTKPSSFTILNFWRIRPPPRDKKVKWASKNVTQRFRSISFTVYVVIISVKLQRALRWAFLFFIEHVFRWPSQSQLRSPTAPLRLPLREPGCGPGLLPTCVRPCPPCDGLGRARPGGGLPPPSWDVIRHSCRTFPLKIPAPEPALPPRGGFDFSGFPSFYFPSCLDFGCGANLRPVPGRFQR